MQFYFIRHGQSENNALWDNIGSSQGRSVDAELTDIGRRQAEILARFLSRANPAAAANGRDSQNIGGFGITNLYCSLMVRAVATGTYIASALGLPLVAWPDAHESGGIYASDEESSECTGLAGNNRAFFQAHYPNLVLPEALGEQGWWNRPYEQAEERPIRAQRFVQELMEKHGQTQDRVAVVSHGGFFNHVLTALLKLPKREGFWFAMNNAAITRIDLEPEKVDLLYTNRVDYMPKELIT